MMIPFQAVMIPQFKIIKYMGLIDTKSSLVAVGIFNAFGTFLLRQFFLTIPKELEEAAKIDGCSYPRIFWEVILKNSKPALMTLIIFTFMNTWNDFLRPLIFINSEEKMDFSYGVGSIPGNVCLSVEPNDGWCIDFYAANLTGVYICTKIFCSGNSYEWN